MPKEDQANADLDLDATGEAADAVDSRESQNGTTDLAAYAEEVERALAQPVDDELPVEEPQEEEPEEATEPAEEVEDESGEEEQQEEEPVAAQPTRFRLKANNEVEAEAFALRKRHPEWSLSECEAKAKAILGIKTETDDKASDEPAETVESCRARLSEIRSRKAELFEEEAQAMEDVDLAKASALRKELAKLDLEADDLRDKVETLREREADKARREQDEFMAAVERSKSLAFKVYPEATDANSAIVAKMVEIDEALRANEDPLWHSPNKPFKLAQMAAAELGIAPRAVVNGSGVKPRQVNGKKPQRPVQPASGNARTSTPDTGRRLSEVIDNLKTVEDYEKALEVILR